MPVNLTVGTIGTILGTHCRSLATERPASQEPHGVGERLRTDMDVDRKHRFESAVADVYEPLQRDDSLWLRRAHSIGHRRQTLNLLTYALGINGLAVHLHRQRHAPPAAA